MVGHLRRRLFPGGREWTGLKEITTASAGANVSFHAAALAYPDVYRLAFVEKYTGTQAYSRLYLSYLQASADYVDNLWREPYPSPQTASDYGFAVTYGGSYAWLSTPNGVWRADLDAPTLDVSADMLELTTDDKPGAGRLQFTLRNDDGQYSTIGEGANAALRFGSEVQVKPGYVTAGGPEISDGPTYWIESFEHISGDGSAAFAIRAADGWSHLDAWRARRQYAWAEGERNVFQLLAFVFARAGLDFSSIGDSNTISDLSPSFTIHPGESGATAAHRLLAMAPDVLLFRGSTALLKEPLSSEASAYSYGTGHAIKRARYGISARQVNRVQAYGDGVLVEGFDWDSIANAYDRLAQVADLNLDTTAKAQDRVNAILRHADIESGSGEIAVPVNCGQELYDVIEITDDLAGLSAEKRRVLGLSPRYLPKRGIYEHRLWLGAP